MEPPDEKTPACARRRRSGMLRPPARLLLVLLVLPGLDPASFLPTQYSQWLDGNYFTMSGIAQSTAVVSGVVALMLEAEPWLAPDEVKCRLMDSAHAAVDASSNLA